MEVCEESRTPIEILFDLSGVDMDIIADELIPPDTPLFVLRNLDLNQLQRYCYTYQRARLGDLTSQWCRIPPFAHVE